MSGVWGEPFDDGNGNRRHDPNESFTDDIVNSAIDPSSVRKYDGIYLGGFGNDRIARGVFDPIWVRTVYVGDPAGEHSLALALDRCHRLLRRPRAARGGASARARSRL